MSAIRGLLWLAETGCNSFLQILMFAKISCCLLKIAWPRSRTSQNHFCHCCRTAKNSHITKHLRLTSGFVNPRKWFSPWQIKNYVHLGEHNFLWLTNTDVNLDRMHQLCNVIWCAEQKILTQHAYIDIGEKLWFILQQLTGWKRATLSGAVPTSFWHFADVSLRCHNIRQSNVFFSHQQRKKCMLTSVLQSKLLTRFLYGMAESWKNLKDANTFSLFSMLEAK